MIMHDAPAAPALWAIGDIHGARARLVALLQAAAIIDDHARWAAGSSVGVCLGDYVNRGEDGAGVIAAIRQWQGEAAAAGGRIIPLLGNHDVLMCGVLAERQTMPYGEFADKWLLHGGRFLDLERLEADVAAQQWLQDLPAMTLIGDTLFVHSDSLAYLELGSSIAEVNAAVHAILQSHDLDRLAVLFDQLSRRYEFRDRADVERLLATFGARRVVHGHTPTYAANAVASHDGRCLNIEGALWESDEHELLGFVWHEA
jgi:hypothetical protein